jgi:DNA-binding NarL/FixJ family response regulator
MAQERRCVRAVLCVESDVLRAGLRSMLERHHPVTVVAECDDTGAAAEATSRLRPDVTVVGTTSESMDVLPLMAQVGNLVLLIDGPLPNGARDDVPTQVVVPMPRTHVDVANLVDILQHDGAAAARLVSREPVRAPWIRVLLLDNHPTVRLAIQTLVQPYENIEVVGNCSTAAEARGVLEKFSVDIVVMELEVLGVEELEEFCLAASNRAHSPKIFVYSSENHPDYVATAIRAGVNSYVHKGVDCARLMDAFHRTCVGERVWLVGADSQEIVNNYTTLTRSAHLTQRERQVIVPLLHRRSNDEIATELCLARQTVKNHVSNILRKVGVRNRRELFQRLGAEAGQVAEESRAL